MSIPNYTPLTEKAQRFIEHLADLGYLNTKQRRAFFKDILEKTEENTISFSETRREIAIFLFDEQNKLTKAEREMLLKEWGQLFS